MSGLGAAVTVVVPVWDDYVEFLADAVESVRRNDPQAPIVVVDNASATTVPKLDGCEIVRSPRRLSAGAARNLGLERVTTEYVVFLDCDDMLLEGTLEFLHARLSADPGLVVCASSLLDGATGERFRGPRRFVPTLVRWPRAFALADSIWSLLPIQGCAMMRTEQVREAGGYADARGEDWVLAVSLVWRGRVEVSKRLGLYYRASDRSLWRTTGAADLPAKARRVRQRMKADPAVPRWARALLPGVAVLQLAMIYLVRPLYLGARKCVRPRSNIR